MWTSIVPLNHRYVTLLFTVLSHNLSHARKKRVLKKVSQGELGLVRGNGVRSRDITVHHVHIPLLSKNNTLIYLLSSRCLPTCLNSFLCQASSLYLMHHYLDSMSSILHTLLESKACHCDHHCFVDVIAVINECMIFSNPSCSHFFAFARQSLPKNHFSSKCIHRYFLPIVSCPQCSQTSFAKSTCFRIWTLASNGSILST